MFTCRNPMFDNLKPLYQNQHCTKLPIIILRCGECKIFQTRFRTCWFAKKRPQLFGKNHSLSTKLLSYLLRNRATQFWRVLTSLDKSKLKEISSLPLKHLHLGIRTDSKRNTNPKRQQQARTPVVIVCAPSRWLSRCGCGWTWMLE